MFSTVHTNDAPSAYTRLLDLGAEEYLLNAAIISIIAQRLVRRLCEHCAKPVELPENDIKTYELEKIASRNGVQISLKEACGCDYCSGTGYKGRIGIIEYLKCDEAIKNLPKDENFPLQARKLNQQRNGRTLLEDGLLKAIQGITTIDEVLRVAG